MITGYRNLSDEEVSSVNQVKAHGFALEHLIASLPDLDPRWKAIAVTDLQKGFMSLVRAITKPNAF